MLLLGCECQSNQSTASNGTRKSVSIHEIVFMCADDRQAQESSVTKFILPSFGSDQRDEEPSFKRDVASGLCV